MARRTIRRALVAPMGDGVFTVAKQHESQPRRIGVTNPNAVGFGAILTMYGDGARLEISNAVNAYNFRSVRIHVRAVVSAVEAAAFPMLANGVPVRDFTIARDDETSQWLVPTMHRKSGTLRTKRFATLDEAFAEIVTAHHAGDSAMPTNGELTLWFANMRGIGFCENKHGKIVPAQSTREWLRNRGESRTLAAMLPDTSRGTRMVDRPSMLMDASGKSL